MAATVESVQAQIYALPDGDAKKSIQARLDDLSTTENVSQDDLDNLSAEIATIGTGGRRRKYSRRGRRSAKKSGGTRRKQKRRQRRGSRRAY